MTSELCNEPILDALRPALLELAVPERADGMAAYMKSAIPFLGVPSPAVRKLVRTLAKKHTFKDAVHLHATITVEQRRISRRKVRSHYAHRLPPRQGRVEAPAVLRRRC